MTRSLPLSLVVVVAVVALVCNTSVVAGAEIGNIATIQRPNGEIIGPYRVKEIHSHNDGHEALPQTALEEGSGDFVVNYDDTEGDDDSELPDLYYLPSDEDVINVPSNKELPAVPIVEDVLNVPVDGELPSVPIEEVFNVPTNGELPAVSVVEDVPNNVPDSEKLIGSNPDIRPLPASILPTESEVVSSEEHSTPTTTQAAVTSKLPTAATKSSTSLSPTVTQDPMCHEQCTNKLHDSFKLSMKPNVTLQETGASVTLTCQVAQYSEDDTENVKLQWLFEGKSSPEGECGLVANQQYLRQCEGFPSNTEQRDTNETHLLYSLTVDKLEQSNSGYYICQATVHCCGQIIQQQERHYLRVWYANYTTELLLLAAVAVGLSFIVVSGVVYQRRRYSNVKQEYIQVLIVPASLEDAANCRSKVLPLPMDDKDTVSENSFDD